MFESFPSTICCCSSKLLPNKIENLASLTFEVASGMFTLDGRWEMEWRAKFRVVGHEQSPKTILERLLVSSLNLLAADTSRGEFKIM